MAEIQIPGDELEDLSGLLGRVMELIDTKPTGFDETAVGAPLASSGGHFESAWSDGRTQLKRQGNQLKDACDQIVKAFTDYDNQSADSLTAK
ncbi:hypothetical protein ACFYXS_10580 [Streptomyces sp. NPDC002574]|uniref:hypothetical protein n=1 Tax=Streptomyces sp. NPDC002574 TaxID=3364652 RepID=UPI0036911A21